MSTDILPFKFQGNQVRIVEIGGEPWFVATDVANILNYRSAPDMTRRIDEADKGYAKVRTPGGEQALSVLSESGLYDAIFRSNAEGAKPFRRWVTGEVLPSIRRTGSYSATPPPALTALSDEEIVHQALQITTRKIAELEAKVEADAPKVLFADAVSASHTSILVGELAKILRGNGVEVGANRLFQRLRDEGYLIRRKGTDWNMPTQYSMELGLFEIKETAITHSDGHVSISKTPKVTGKGQAYFVSRYVGEQVAA